MRGKDYGILNLPVVQTRLRLPADQQFSLPESPLVRTLYDCPNVTVGADEQHSRLVVATHPKGPKKQKIGVERDGLIYELFLTTLPQDAFTASDVVALASSIVDPLKRPSRMRMRSKTRIAGVLIVLADKKPGRSSRNGSGTYGWNWDISFILIPCVPPRRAPAIPPSSPTSPHATPPSGYASPQVGLPWKEGRFSSQDAGAPARRHAAVPCREHADLA